MSTPYVFDRFIGGRKMAEGVRIHHAASEAEAREKAYMMYARGAKPGEMDRTTFVLRDADGQSEQK